ncbi:MAG TPA: universal stress protein [Longimicrobiales bacterium]|nr:universal stress protein [Longimicrobiales bacterium]
MQIRKIVVPLDGSNLAEHALPFAATLARASEASLHLVSVVPAAAFADPVEFPAIVSNRLHQAHEAVRRYIEGAAARVTRITGIPTTGEVRVQMPAIAILAVLEEQRADLLVMTSHGRGGIARAWLGSTADALVRHSFVPVFVLKPDTNMEVDLRKQPKPGSILVPLDGSPLAEAALEPAIAMARAWKASITFLMVAEHPLAIVPYPLNVEPVVLLEQKERGERYLAKTAERVIAEGVEVSTLLLEDTGVARAITEYAQDRTGGMIAMATHGRGGLRRLLMGSVADKVLRGSELPVLVVRPDSRGQKRSRPDPVDREPWADRLAGFDRRNRNQPVQVEEDTLALGVQREVDGLELTGVSYDPKDDRVTVMVEGEGAEHLTHTIRAPDSIDVTDAAGGEVLRVAHSGGQALIQVKAPPASATG